MPSAGYPEKLVLLAVVVPKIEDDALLCREAPPPLEP